MATDSRFYDLPEPFDDFTFLNEAPTPNLEQSTNFEYGLDIEDTSLSMDVLNDVFPPSLDFGTQVQSLNESPDIKCLDDHEFDPVFKFLNQFLMEESKDEKDRAFYDPLALQETERSFYEVMSKEYPPSPYIDKNIECPNSLNKRTCESNGNSVDPSSSGDPGFHRSSRSIQFSYTNSQPLAHSVNSSISDSVGQIDSLMNMNLTPSQFSDTEFKLHFRKGMEEARKFLPSDSELVTNLDKNTLDSKAVEEPPKVEFIVEKDHSTRSRGRKHLYCHDSGLEARSSKQPAVYEDEDEEISKECPPSPCVDTNIECPNSLNKGTCESNENSVDPSSSGYPGCHRSSRSIQLPHTNSQPLAHSVNSSISNGVGQIDSLMNMNLTPSQFSDTEFKLHFRKGMEEARKFLPSDSELVINLDKNTLASNAVEEPPTVEVIVEKDHSTRSRGRKHLYCHDSGLDARSSKQPAVYEDEVELSRMFDNLFLSDTKGVKLSSKGEVKFLNGFDKYWQQNSLPRVPRNGKAPNKKQGAESEVIGLQTLLLNCAQAAASNDLPGAHEKLKQIKQYASSTGDACQRVANVFANGLEARLAGTGAQMYTALTSKRITASEMLKAYEADLSACPFVANTRINTNKKILKIAANGSSLHIVDFGISYGFQWPLLIQYLSIRLGGPPKLRITGIDVPQAGFRPAELIKETGQRLARHCKRFNVPFEYQAIERHSWETIDMNDLKLERDEVLVVNCLLRFENLPEEEVLAESPKDGILKLIRSMKPDLFLLSIVNGLYNAPLFMTRFREALFHYASLFDMLDVTLPRSDPQRFHFEKEFGHEVLNVIACEGQQRVVRPETYKQWQIRCMRARFKIVPLEKDSGQRREMEAHYHKHFLYDENCNWMLQGWKGRVLYASSCWVPV